MTTPKQIYHVEVLLDGKTDKEKRGARTDDRLNAFLMNHPTAKIIIIVNTHSLDESGAFVWGGTNPRNYLTCYMFEVGVPLYPTWPMLTSDTHIDTQRLPPNGGLAVYIN